MKSKKIKETDLAYAKGVKDGFSSGIKTSIDFISKSIEESNDVTFKSNTLLNKAALTVFASKLIVELSKLGQ